MNFSVRILVVSLLIVGTLIATAKTVTILHNNEITRNKIAEEQKILADRKNSNTLESSSPATPNTQAPIAVKNSTQTTATKTTFTAPSPYSLAKIALHTNPSDCWIIISNKIYGVTSFLNQHPGGASAITQYCGKDATTAFQTHGHTGGSNHSSYAYSLLASYFISAVSSGVTTNTAASQTPPTNQTANTTITTPGIYSLGDHVQVGTLGIVNVRNTANGTLLGKQNPGVAGTIIGGPTSAGGYTWWKVNFDSGVDGWVAQNYIQVFSALPVPVPVQPGAYSITVTKTGSGSGTVSGGGISCGSTCSVAFTQSSAVTLTASPSSDSSFSGWGGSCSGTGSCTVTVSSVKSVTASFTLTTVAPTPVPITPASSGYTSAQISVHNSVSDCWLLISNKVYNVSSFISNHPGGVSAISTRCGTDATVAFNTKNGGGSHSAYAQSLLATYYIGDLGTTPVPTPPAGSYTLSVSKLGTGSGTVSGGAISCGSTCGVNLNAGTSVTLVATPTSGSTFSGWSGACSGTGNCTVTMNSTQNVGASFTSSQANTFSLSISSIGGVVTSNPAGISCGSVCSATFAPGTSVTLSVSPTSGYTFSGWSGACSGTGSCVVSMNANASVSTNYTTNTPAGGTTYTSAQIATHNVRTDCWLLISNKVYNVSSFISNHPGGVSAISTRCGTDATIAFNTKGGQGSHSAYAQSLLATYYIGDLGSGTPTPTPTPAPGSYSLSVSKSGTGSGTVSGSGISCGSTCSVNATAGTTITLSATASSGSTFSGWTGACSGTGSCSVTLNSNQSVGASFTNTGGTGGGTGGATYTINVNSSGNYDVTNLTIHVGDSINFVYTPPISGEVKTRFSPTGISSVTLDHQYTQKTRTFTTTGTWTFTAEDHNGNTGTLTVQ